MTDDEVSRALDTTQELTVRTARALDGLEEHIAQLARRVANLEATNDRLRHAIAP
jgi:hypothetical protein